MADAADVILEVAGRSIDSMTRKQLIAVTLVTLLVVSIVAGLSFFSTDSSETKTSAVFGGEDGWRAHSVVAPIDTGINVYHDHFRTNETYPQWLQDGLGVNKVCDLTFEGTWQERYDADRSSCRIDRERAAAHCRRSRQ